MVREKGWGKHMWRAEKSRNCELFCDFFFVGCVCWNRFHVYSGLWMPNEQSVFSFKVVCFDAWSPRSKLVGCTTYLCPVVSQKLVQYLLL